ncbi:hypothetical protein [uncultured Pluralibacter sp.]|jgi:hypothetical protein|uniref:hypothetical protein n=1 Tax=uncultured Pluralibacter sp. TaxID=1490864 RepID=UPI002616DCE2|nr:hypothetical protein [uncultured Pluralibacter sp.]
MTENEEAEFKRMMGIVVKKSVVWYREQDFSHMNDDVRIELESLFSEGDKYDPMASVTISLNLMMMGNALQDKRLNVLAARAAQMSGDVKTLGKPEGKVALRLLLDEISELLKESQFYEADKAD